MLPLSTAVAYGRTVSAPQRMRYVCRLKKAKSSQSVLMI